MRLITITNFNQLTTLIHIYVYPLSHLRWFFWEALWGSSIQVFKFTHSPPLPLPRKSHLLSPCTFSLLHSARVNLTSLFSFSSLLFFFCCPFSTAFPPLTSWSTPLAWWIGTSHNPDIASSSPWPQKPPAIDTSPCGMSKVRGPAFYIALVGEEGHLGHCADSIIRIILFIRFIYLFLIRLKWCPLVLWLCFLFLFIFFVLFCFVCEWCAPNEMLEDVNQTDKCRNPRWGFEGESNLWFKCYWQQSFQFGDAQGLSGEVNLFLVSQSLHLHARWLAFVKWDNSKKQKMIINIYI